jgi:hypothetical protein
MSQFKAQMTRPARSGRTAVFRPSFSFGDRFEENGDLETRLGATTITRLANEEGIPTTAASTRWNSWPSPAPVTPAHSRSPGADAVLLARRRWRYGGAGRRAVCIFGSRRL